MQKLSMSGLDYFFLLGGLILLHMKKQPFYVLLLRDFSYSMEEKIDQRGEMFVYVSGVV